MNDEIDGKSLDLKAQRLAQLREIFPEFFSEGRLDLSAVKEVLGDEELTIPDHYELSWAGKAEARREIQKQTTATLIPDKEGSINFDTSENVFIEGENLEVLRVLQKAYFGRIKMIYIDPPYNTGNDNFIYPDDFAERKDEYLRRTGQTNGGGYLNKLDLFRKNTKENGQYHSVWLSMMYPRLYLARNLLREDGVIFISIDDNEVHNLRAAMNEIFGEENFVASIVWQKKQSPQNDATYFSDMHDYILVYAKQVKATRGDEVGWDRNLLDRTDEQRDRYSNPDNDPRGVWASTDCSSNKNSEERPNLYYSVINPITGEEVFPSRQRVWRFEKTKMEELISDNRLYWGENGRNFPRMKTFLSEVQSGVVPSTWWTREFAGDNQKARREIRSIFDEGDVDFDTPKPTLLLKRMIEIGTKDGDIVLDFFAGSGTTAHAILEMNEMDGGRRKFILVQMPEKLDEESATAKAGYKSIADICRERITKVIGQIQTKANGKMKFASESHNAGFRSYKLQYSNFKHWNTQLTEPSELLKQIEIFKEPLKAKPDDSLHLLTELLIKSGIPLSAKIERKVTKNATPFFVVEGHLIYALDTLGDDLLDEIEALQPTMFVTLGNLFTGEKADETMTNWKLQLQESGIEFKLI